MKKIVFSIMLVNIVFARGMSKDSELTLDNNAKFTPQVLKLFEVNEFLIRAYKNRKNREDLRFLAFRLYYLKFNFESTPNGMSASNAILQDQVNYIEPLVGTESSNIETITRSAWNTIYPKIMNIANREDWTPEFTQNIVDNFWNIYWRESNSPERKKQKEKYAVRKKEEDERLKFFKQGKLEKPKALKKEKK